MNDSHDIQTDLDWAQRAATKAMFSKCPKCGAGVHRRDFGVSYGYCESRWGERPGDLNQSQFCRIRELEAQLASANQRIRELTEWRPMSSAPRDGREVRLHNSSVADGVNTWAGRWVERADGTSAWMVWYRRLDDSQFTGWLPLTAYATDESQ